MALDQTRLFKPVKKLRKLLRTLDSDCEPEQVHKLRTNARRFEATFKAMAFDDAAIIPKSTFKDLGRLRKRAGKVRDMDVLTEFAAAIRPNGEAQCHVCLLEHLGARRQKQAAKLRADVKQLGRRLHKTLGQASSRVAKILHRSGAGEGSAAANAAATAVRLSAQLAAPARLNKTNLHPYRLKVKELQNVLLIAEAASPLRFVEDLGSVKDAIGEWHDWDVLVGIASKLLDHDGSCLLLAKLNRIAESKYDHALSLGLKLRKAYLQGTDRKGKNAARSGVPRPPVWEAMAGLAG